MYQNAGDYEGQKKMVDSHRTAIMSSLIWLLQNKGISSARAVWTSKQWVISPTPNIKFSVDNSSVF